MTKVVLNKCYGGFGLSPQAYLKVAELKGISLFIYDMDYNYTGDYSNHTYHRVTPSELKKDNQYRSPMYLTKDLGKTVDKDTFSKEYSKYYFSDHDLERTDPDLIAVVELLGKKANGMCSDLKIIEIPDDVSFEIEAYDGQEWVAEVHRTWG